jgi:hypothetical protein
VLELQISWIKVRFTVSEIKLKFMLIMKILTKRFGAGAYSACTGLISIMMRASGFLVNIGIFSLSIIF